MRVAIVGGGISGLALAERLAAEGAEPVVLEAAGRVGGKVGSFRKDGFTLECGPNGFLDKEPKTLELADRIGLGGELHRASPVAGRRWIHVRGALREVPTRPQAFLRSDVLPWPAKVRLAMELFTEPKPEGKDESIAEFGRRHLGERATSDLLGAMVLGIYGGDVERLSLQSCFPRMAELEREHRSLLLAMIRLQRERRKALPQPGAPAAGGPAGPGGVLTSVEGGLGAYVARLGERLGPVVHAGVRVEGLERAGGRWLLHTTQQGAAASLEADAIALAVPADEAARLVAPLDPALADLAGGIGYAPMAVVHLAWPRERIAHPLDGFGFLIPPNQNKRILGAIFTSSIFPWRAPEGQALLTVMVGGAIRPELALGSEASIAAIAREELAAIIGAQGDPSLCEVVKWERAIPQYVVGHEARRTEADARASRLPGLVLAGNAWRGIGFNDCVAAAPMLAARLLGRG